MDLQTSGNNTNKDNIDDDANGLRKLGAQLKDSIFGIVFIILKEHETSIYVAIILCIIEFIQTISLAFHKEVLFFMLFFSFVNSFCQLGALAILEM